MASPLREASGLMPQPSPLLNNHDPPAWPSETAGPWRALQRLTVFVHVSFPHPAPSPPPHICHVMYVAACLFAGFPLGWMVSPTAGGRLTPNAPYPAAPSPASLSFRGLSLPAGALIQRHGPPPEAPGWGLGCPCLSPALCPPPPALAGAGPWGCVPKACWKGFGVLILTLGGKELRKGLPRFAQIHSYSGSKEEVLGGAGSQEERTEGDGRGPWGRPLGSDKQKNQEHHLGACSGPGS